MPRGDVTLTVRLHAVFFHPDERLRPLVGRDFRASGVTFSAALRLIFSKRINLNNYLKQL